MYVDCGLNTDVQILQSLQNLLYSPFSFSHIHVEWQVEGIRVEGITSMPCVFQSFSLISALWWNLSSYRREQKSCKGKKN